MDNSAQDPHAPPAPTAGESPEALRAELARMRATLDECNRQRDIVFSVIGHDLRTPVSQINALLYLLRERPDAGFSDEKRERFILDLERSKEQILLTLDNLLQWSRVHDRHFAPEFLLLASEDLVAGAIAANAADAAVKDIRVIALPVEERQLTTDPNLASFILRNLLANAIKFSGPAGLVRIEAEVCGEDYVCCVVDQGKGLTPEQIAVLEVGQGMGSTPGTFGERGVGLGLQVSHLFARQIGGRLSFSSAVGQGTRASLHLPLKPPSNPL
jgi:cell cycle sensor histidine kinase DivJ